MSFLLSTVFTLDFVSKLYHDYLLQGHSANFGKKNSSVRHSAAFVEENVATPSLPDYNFELLENLTVSQLQHLELSKLDVDVHEVFEDFFEDMRNPEESLGLNTLINVGFKEFYHKLHVSTLKRCLQGRSGLSTWKYQFSYDH